jgi:hypothetical protein
MAHFRQAHSTSMRVIAPRGNIQRQEQGRGMNTRFAHRMSAVRPAAIYEILKATEQALIAFAGV